ncbi:hypothetical protein [Afipia sp. GAS231]|uniref:hypothetical protein n=1 Tax=Afipia sp. GAS231 TaxID=1882747 RepID=UPI00087BD540|nr:hypothetical protein [Afipia sp. GAS231]SDP32746.1 hypothetical protein SAMN05444050_6492 [Afipia sp. GAS231]
MNLDGSISTDGDRSATASKRWFTDAAGRTIYYPYGAAYSGYIVTEAARERAIRAADQRFEDISKPFAPYTYGLLLAVTCIYYYFSSSHPLLACAAFPAALVLAGLIAWLARRSMIVPLLAGLDRAPAADPSGRKPLYRAAYVLLALSGLIALVLHLYDLRVATIAADSTTVDFYPDISGGLLNAGIFGLLLLGAIAGMRKAKTCRVRATAAVLVLAVLALIPAIEVAENFYNPQPRIVLEDVTLSCRWKLLWFDVTSVSLRSGSRGRQYARVEYAVSHTAFGDVTRTQDCEIDGLTVDYTEVYDAIRKRWQVAVQGQPAIDSMADKPTTILREKLRRIPLGTSREEVTAILGEPIATYPLGFGQVQLYPLDHAGKPSGLTPEAWRVVAVFFDERHWVDRLAAYRLNNGKIVDDVSHETLATNSDYYALSVVLLDPLRSTSAQAKK